MSRAISDIGFTGLKKKNAKALDRLLLYALAGMGDTNAAVELGHFGNETTKDAIALIKYARTQLRETAQ